MDHTRPVPSMAPVLPGSDRVGRIPSTAEQAAHMRMRQEQNRAACRKSAAEAWLAAELKTTGRKWTRQAIWGWRLFDFWNRDLGIAIEVDGPEHDEGIDRERDAYNFKRSGILVLRVPNWDEEAARAALDTIAHAGTWNERRGSLGLKLIR